MNGSRRPAEPCETCRRSSSAFTLVELLVVIGIIAILIGVLLPALNKARQQSLKVACSAQLRNLGQACLNYAANNKGWLPQHPGNLEGTWIWDIRQVTRDQLVKYGADRKTLYCPVYSEADKDGLWTYQNGVTVLGYGLVIERGPSGGPPPYPMRNGPNGYPDHQNWLLTPATQYFIAGYGFDPKKKLVNKTSGQGRPAPQLEVAFDIILQDTSGGNNNGKFVTTGGFRDETTQLFPHATSHMGKGGLPLGQNVLFLDGHVDWREWTAGTGMVNTQYQKSVIKPRYRPGTSPTFWF
jgi:prepilin-type N-terminal cleavage/methylation domain-containing protein/prepilin-type processing-associated H-X9-DG protein